MEPPEELSPHNSPTHWGYYFTVMSLRKGRPFWGDMGLSLSASTADALYELTTTTLNTFMGQSTLLTQVPGTHCMEVLGHYLRAVADLSADELDDEASHIVRWILCTFLGGREENYEWLWDISLHSLYWQLQKEKDLGGISDERKKDLESVVVEFVTDLKATNETLDRASSESLCESDKRILSYYDIHSSEDIKELASPFYFISRTYMVVRFRHLWLDLIAKGDQEIMDFLYDKFQRDAQKKGVNKSRPYLIHPPIPESW